MEIRMQRRRALLALALFGLAAAAAQARDETSLAVRTRAGTIERVDAGDVSTLAPGETRALATRSGSAATITRTEEGLLLAVAGDQYPIAMPGLGADGAMDERLVRRADGGDAHGVHEVVVVRHGDGHGAHNPHDADDADAALAGLGLPDLDDDEALLAAGEGPAVFVRRTKVLEAAPPR